MPSNNAFMPVCSLLLYASKQSTDWQSMPAINFAELYNLALRCEQGDQIGRIFAYVLGDCFLRVFFLDYRRRTNFCSPLFPTENAMYVLRNFDKKRLGLHLGRFLTKSSGHPGCD
jgi:hypothetical protein